MTITRGGKVRRGRWVLTGLLAAVLGVGALVVYAGWTSSAARKQARLFEVKKAERVEQETAKVEAARQALPKDAGVAPNWTVDAWAAAQQKDRPWDLVTWVRGVLEAPDVLDERFGSVKGVARMQEFVQGRRAENSADPSWQALDLSIHTPEEVVDALGQRVMGIEPLRELERALDHGLIPQRQDDGGGAGWYEAGIAVDLIAFRAYAEARAANPDAATTSLLHAFALARVSAKPYSPVVDYEYPWRGLRKTLAAIWTHAPMANELRERWVAGLTLCDQERVADYLRVYPAQAAAFRVEAAPGVEEIPTPFLRSAISVVYSACKTVPYSGAPERALEYAKLLPSRPIDVYPRIAAMLREVGWSGTRDGRSGGLRGEIRRGTRDTIAEAADAHVGVWRWASLPDILRFAFSVEDYRRAHGCYPANTTDAPELAPLPVDPATDKPMEYRSGTKGFSLQFPDAPQYPARGRRYFLPEWSNAQ